MKNSKSKSLNIRINKIYTRSGDLGKTKLIGGVERYKDDIRVECYGTVDELNAELGLCRELLRNENNSKFDILLKLLKIIQNELFDLGTQLASDSNYKKTQSLPNVNNESILKLESEIDSFNENLSELKSFVLPGGSLVNAQFHIARNVCRRAERRVVSLSKIESIDPINIKYLNRLSDALFVWSRWTSYVLNDEENLWDPNY